MSEEKASLRREILAQRSKLTQEEIFYKSNAVDEILLREFSDVKITTLMAFMPFRNEIASKSYMELFLEGHRRLVLPRVDASKKSIQIFEVSNLENDLETSSWGIKEPKLHLPKVDPLEIDIILIPGVVFDRKGFRIGYGGGFYDQFLPLTRAYKVGIGFALQITKQVPVEDWDVQLDAIITENGIEFRREQ
jgi:5-formyltetrahydrofolate cyclo-ligase